ncbi:MAG: acetylornithine deacetylase [Pseudomonadota bacterium]|nr:acetylornithine deacetylase [Pseudomonadota bacterium]
MTAVAHPRREAAISLLADLVGFPSVSLRPNGPIVTHIESYLKAQRVTCWRDSHPDGERFNMLARIGPEMAGGVLLSGHLDVVPAGDGGWGADPFTLHRRNGRLFGRGAVDMKGFLAMALAMVPDFMAQADRLSEPLYLAFTFDEEIGCFGAERMPAFLKSCSATPRLAVIGEPTGMKPINGHKGGMELMTRIKGVAGHASRPSNGVNAVHAAARLINFIEELAAEYAANPVPGSPFDPPCSTLSVGTVSGGSARNIIAGECRLDWEIRALPGDDPLHIHSRVTDFIDKDLLPAMKVADERCTISTEMLSNVPPLGPKPDCAATELVSRLWTNEALTVVSFGTDGPFFQQAGMDVIVIGPGGMAQMHQMDEYITEQAVDEGLTFLERLLSEMTGSAGDEAGR